MIRHTNILSVAVVIAALLACSDRPTAPSETVLSAAAAKTARFELASASATLEWQATARGLVVSHPTVSPIVATRIYALLGVGQYGAVVAADDGYDLSGEGRALYEARRGAVAGASASILEYLFPDAHDALVDQLRRTGEAGPGQTHPHFTRGVATGLAMGARMIDWASNDGFSATWDGKAPPDPLGGGWVGTAAAPAGFQFPTMTPYYLTTQSQFRPSPPPARGSAAFEADLAIVRDIARSRTFADTALANTWNLNVGTITALGYWDERAAEYILAAGMDERSASHIFALVNSAGMDAIIGCWEAKYHYMFIRPSKADPTITLSPGRVGFPYGLPNHPSYPSGHSCVSAAAAHVVGTFFPEHAATLNAQVLDAGRSRVVGGIHYPFDVTAGQGLGRAVAEWAMAYDRQPGGLLAALDK